MKPLRITAAVGGVTLLELLLTLALIAVLAAIAYPAYREQVVKTRRAEVQAQLLAQAQRLERMRSETGCYAPAPDGDCTGEALPALNVEHPHYEFRFVGPVDPEGFVLEAVPRADGTQAGDGLLRIDALGRRSWDENDDGDLTDPGEADWLRD